MVDSNTTGPFVTPVQEREFALAIDQGDAPLCSRWLERATSREALHALAGLSDEQRAKLLQLLSVEDAVDVIEQLPEPQVVDALEDLDPPTAAGILGELPSDDRADLIQALDESSSEAILSQLHEGVAEEVRRLAAYDEESAGGLMVTEYLAFTEKMTVREVFADLDANADRYSTFDVQYTYVTDSGGLLLGVIPIRRLLLGKRSTVLRDVMIPDPIAVSEDEHLDVLAAMFRDHSYIGLPVVNAAQKLLGVVQRRAVETAQAEESEDLYRQSLGIIGGEELRTMPLIVRARRRIAWLSTNILLNIAAASVIAFHQDTLEAVIALAVFLPIISDMSGCSGNQAVAVSMRELTLGVTQPREVGRVLLKESTVGILNGIVLGLLIGLVAFFWKGNPYLGLVVGGALMLNTVVAVCIGGTVPLMLKGLKLDPALASGPILTTITDLCGFLLVLSFAAAMMSRLVG